MKISRWILALVITLPMLANADAPVTSPSANLGSNNGPMDEAPMRPRFFRSYGSSRAEWDDMMQFLSENSPNRFRVINDRDVWSNNFPARMAILKKWRDYRFVAEHFPEVAVLRKQRFQVEDQIFGLELQAKHNPASINDLRPQIHDKAAELVKLSIQERQLRIDKLEKTLATERQKLTDEQSQQETLVDQRTDKIMNRLEAAAGVSTTQPSNP